MYIFVDVFMHYYLEITDLSVCAIMRNCGELEEAILKGLKRISDVPFLPIISGNLYSQFIFILHQLHNKLRQCLIFPGHLKDLALFMDL